MNEIECLEKEVASMNLNTHGDHTSKGLPDGDLQGRLQHTLRQLKTTTCPARCKRLEVEKSVLQRVLASTKSLKLSNECNGAFDPNKSLQGAKWALKRNQGIQQVKDKTLCRAKIEALFAAHRPNELSSIDEIIARNEGNYDQIFERWIEAKEFSATAVQAAHIKAVQRTKNQLRNSKS
jgi:hypothetical protein